VDGRTLSHPEPPLAEGRIDQHMYQSMTHGPLEAAALA
jgi:hypothetical protein